MDAPGASRVSSEQQPWPVSRLAATLKDWIDRLGYLWIEGELSQIRINPTSMFGALRDLQVESFAVPHDAQEPVGFRFTSGHEGDLFAPRRSLAWLTDLGHAPQNVRDALGATVLNPKRLGNPVEYANLALCMIENGYFNGEDVRLDGGIRMTPR